MNEACWNVNRSTFKIIIEVIEKNILNFIIPRKQKNSQNDRSIQNFLSKFCKFLI